MFLPPPPLQQESNTHADLRPDPIFMIVVWLVESGPIGWVRTRIEAWQDYRDERRETAAAIAAASDIVLRSSKVSTFTEHQASDDLAA